MRVKQPKPFDREREYKPGERAIVNGSVLIATLWTPPHNGWQIAPKHYFADVAFVVRLEKIFAPEQI